MRRRRQKNTLLPKMIGLAVLVNTILLPILAQFGVFKSVRGSRLTEVKLVKLPPPEKKPAQEKATPKKRVAKAKPHPSARKTALRPAQTRPARPNPNLPHVAVAPGTSGNGPGIEQGTLAPGQTPQAAPATPTSTAPQASPPPPAPAQPPVEQHPAVVAPPPPPPHKPLLVAAVPLSEPRPRLPDDLSFSDSPAPLEALFTVRPDGTESVKMLASTGNATLDDLALEAAKNWTFRPATQDGHPVESYLRLTVNFDVS